MTLAYMFFVLGAIQLVTSYMVTTKNFTSHIVFKVVPIISSITMLVHALSVLGWVKVTV